MDDKTFCKKYRKEKIKYYSNALLRRVVNKELFKLKLGEGYLEKEKGCEEIYRLLTSDDPFLVSRFGGTEIRTVADVLYERAGGHLGGLNKKSINRIVNLSGFFPADKEAVYKFVDIYTESCKEIDILGSWNIFMHEEIRRMFSPNARCVDLNVLDPYQFEYPWSYGLKNRKVLVIHPFSNTIENQYQKRVFIFQNEKILPEFELHTLKAVQTLAGRREERYSDWFEALDYMKTKALEEDFEIALVACGAYGLPLSAQLKKAGKQVIHVGGSLQLLFGIKGARWDNSDVAKMYNNYWVRPTDEDRIPDLRVVEKGCYW